MEQASALRGFLYLAIVLGAFALIVWGCWEWSPALAKVVSGCSLLAGTVIVELAGRVSAKEEGRKRL